MAIFTVRTTVGQESLVAEILEHKIRKEGIDVFSLSIVPDFKGYILIESEDQVTAQRAITNAPHIKSRGLVEGQININELSKLLEAKPLMKAIKVGMTVELVAGPFKGEKAKVLRVNPTKEEVTVEPLEAAVKVPITMSAEHIRIIAD